MNNERAPNAALERVCGLAIVGILFALYAASAPPTVTLEDDGEFVMAAYFLGIAHPPGYPLFTLLAHVATWLPIGSVAYRVHLLSGLFGALAAGVLYFALRRLAAAPWAAAGAALAFGMSRVFWSQTIIADVYSLQVLLTGGLWLMALRVRDSDGAPRDVRLLALVAGLGLANHWPLTVLAGPAALILCFGAWRALLRPAPLLLGVAAAALPYAWLVLRSLQEPVVSFYGPLRTFHEIFFFVSRAGYADTDVSPNADWADRFDYAAFFFSEWVGQFLLGGWLLAALGAVALWRRGERAAVLSIAWLLASSSVLLILLLGFDYGDQFKAVFRVYPLPSYYATAVFLGCGLDALARLGRAAWMRPAALGTGAVLLAAIAVAGVRENWRANDDWARAYAAAVLEEAPPNAVVVALSDWTAYPVGYLHLVENVRPDCTLGNSNGLLFGPRLFNPILTDGPTRKRRMLEHLHAQEHPVVFADMDAFWDVLEGQDQFLLFRMRKAGDTLEPPRLSPAAHAFYERYLRQDHPYDRTIRFVQRRLRERYFFVRAQLDPLAPAALDAACTDFYSCIGLAEGVLKTRSGYTPSQALALVQRAAARAPHDLVPEAYARLHELRGYALYHLGDRAGALAELEESVRIAPEASLPARNALERLRQGTDG